MSVTNNVKLHLFLRAEKLPPLKNRRKLDTYAVVSYQFDHPSSSIFGKQYRAIGRTEVVRKSLDPEYSTTIILPQCSTTPPFWSKLFVAIYHTNNHADLRKAIKAVEHVLLPTKCFISDKEHETSDFICSVEFDVNHIMQSPYKSSSAVIPGFGSRVHLTVDTGVLVNLDNSNGPSLIQGHSSVLTFQLRGFSLSNLRISFLDRSHFYFEMFRKIKTRVGDCWGLVYRSRRENDTLNPYWPPDHLDLERLCNNCINCYIKVRVVDCDESGNRTPLGCFECTVEMLIAAQSVRGNCDTDRGFTIRNKKGGAVGRMIVIKAEITQSVPRSVSLCSSTLIAKLSAPPSKPVLLRSTSGLSVPNPLKTPMRVPLPLSPKTSQCSPVLVQSSLEPLTFDDYLAAGCELDVSFAIDFSSSNEKSLHQFDESGKTLNIFQWAMAVISTVADKLNLKRNSFSVWGVNGSFQETVYNIFQCGISKEIQGVQGVLDAYRHVMCETELLFGRQEPLFDDVIQAAIALSNKAKKDCKADGKLAYRVLVLLTQNPPTTLLKSKSKLLLASQLPLTISYIMVRGNSASESAPVSLQSSSHNFNILSYGCRSFVSFVPCSNQDRESAQTFASKTFTDISEHAVNYFKCEGICVSKRELSLEDNWSRFSK